MSSPRFDNAEPALTSFKNPITCYFAATRPAFLTATLVACMLGVVGANYSGISFHPQAALATVILAALVHAGVNVLNDYFDALSGTDALNIERLYPYTGGSRFIQNGVLTTLQTAYFGYTLLGIALIGGIWLSCLTGVGLLIIGAIGIFIGWAYSANPFRLNGRGLGELCVLAGFLGIVIGADYVQRRAFSFQPFVVGMPYALLVTNLLYINQFPDRKADAASGKRHLVVRLPLGKAQLIYPLLAGFAFAWLTYAVYIGKLPVLAMISALPFLFSVYAYRLLRQFSSQPAQLLTAIKLTLAAMLSHGLLLIVVILWEML